MKFKRPIHDPNKIYYYCNLNTALECILPKEQLLISPIIKTNDPRENKGLLFSYGSDENFPHIDIQKLNEKYSTMIKEDCKVLCFSQDYKDYQGCHLSKMWAQYGGNHTGICLEINKDFFLEENSKKIESELFKKITYSNYSYLRQSTLRNINLTQLKVLGEKEYIQNKFRKDHLDLLFFTKNNEWEAESELRLILFSRNDENEFCSLKKSLESIHLGIDFHDSYLSVIKKFSKGRSIFKTMFLHDGLVSSFLDNR